MTTVLKLGGSIITEKDSPETVDDAALDAAAEAVAGNEDLVLVHGAGSFGHYYADAYDVTTTDGTHDPAGVRTITGAMKQLSATVVGTLADRGVPAVPVHPFSAARRDAEGALTMPTEHVGVLLAEGFVPVLHGDLVAHEGAGATVLSGDEVVVELARGLDADRVGLCSTVPGVLDSEGAVIDRIDAFDDAADALGGSDATDVSGGMAGKVRTLLDLHAPAQVFGPDKLAEFLAGDTPGTTVGGR